MGSLQNLLSNLSEGMTSPTVEARITPPAPSTPLADYKPSALPAPELERLVWGENKPDFANMEDLDLRSLPRLQELFTQAVDLEILKRSEANVITFIAAAKKALKEGSKNACGLFRKTLTDKEKWGTIPFAYEESARNDLNRIRQKVSFDFFTRAHTDEELYRWKLQEEARRQAPPPRTQQPPQQQQQQPRKPDPIPSTKESTSKEPSGDLLKGMALLNGNGTFARMVKGIW